VAEHSLLVEDIFGRMRRATSAERRLTALLHDAPEYVIGDMISPVKAAVGPGYEALDDRLAAAVHLRFGLPAVPPAVSRRRSRRPTGSAPGWRRRRSPVPDDACAIATFLDRSPQPPGAATALFEATAAAARRLHYRWISADIGPANTAARIYYQNRGFRLYSTQIDRILMRYDLD
jgi:GNAT superfamily N-acetyltransferase